MRDFTPRSGLLSAGIGAGLLFGACAVLLWTPWHGPTILWLSSAHGIDAGDLPALALIALALAVAHARAQAVGAGTNWLAGRWIGGQGRSWRPPVALFLAGSVVDAALAPSGTLIGPILVAIWGARTASYRREAAILYIIAAVFTAATVASLAHQGAVDLARGGGGVARSAALGLLLFATGVLGAQKAG